MTTVNDMAKRRDGKTVRKPIRYFRDLDVYQNALATGLRADSPIRRPQFCLTSK